jgi:hypothetical protein
MTLRFARNASLLLIMLKSVASAATLSDGMEKGKNYYFAAEFKKAISQFELVMNANPDNPQAYLWLGKSYEMLADLKPLFGMHTRMKAQMYLTRSVELAPGCDECRRELFDLLVTSDESPSALREASLLVEKTPQSDPEYRFMQSLLANAQQQSYSPESMITSVFSVPSQSLARLGVHRKPLMAEQRGVAGSERKVPNTSNKRVLTVSREPAGE